MAHSDYVSGEAVGPLQSDAAIDSDRWPLLLTVVFVVTANGFFWTLLVAAGISLI